ncbi:hypothetical protein ABZ547_41155 [Streptomyces sparsogenes]|uniref:hypothetical protein n=1 Tax=Streptomyces sparsogenes TaxID=67365 RepID=UPI0033CB5B5C
MARGHLEGAGDDTMVEKAERIAGFAIGARERDERLSLNAWQADGERGPGEQ